MGVNKTTQNDQDVDELIDSIADEKRRHDAKKLVSIFKKMTGEEPKMWGASIVGFGAYSYKYRSGREGIWMLTGFSPRKSSFTLYIMPGFDEYAEESGYDPQAILDSLGDYKTGKSCLYIKSLDTINVSALERLIRTSYNHMKKNNKLA